MTPRESAFAASLPGRCALTGPTGTNGSESTERPERPERTQRLDGAEADARAVQRAGRNARSWRVLVMDADPFVHTQTSAALSGRVLLGRPLELIHAHTCAQAQAVLLQERDVAVVMVHADAQANDTGWAMLEYIRRTAGLRNTRIVLRTGDAAQVPDLETLLQYDINDYRARSELTAERLVAMLTTAVRSYDQRCTIDAHRRSLEHIVRSSASLMEETDLPAFAASAISQLADLLGVPAHGMAVIAQVSDSGQCCQVLAAKGSLAVWGGQSVPVSTPSPSLQMAWRALRWGRDIYSDGCCDRHRPSDRDTERAGGRGNGIAVSGGAAADGFHTGPCSTPHHGCSGDSDANDGSDASPCSAGVALFIARNAAPDMVIVLEGAQLNTPLDGQLLDVFRSNLQTLLYNRDLLERLHQFAYFDPLVMLPNRAHLVERVDACVRAGGAQAHLLALIDIDDFSAANDVMGHRFGDRLLQAVARRLAGVLPHGALLARVGADTFGVLGALLPQELIRLLESVRTPVVVDGVPHKVSLTCGYVRLPHHVQAGTDLVKDATIALKRAKRDHRGQHLEYSEHMGAEARDRAVLLSDLRAAMEQQQLFLVYQPQLDLQTQALVGLEALVRWRTADGRWVPPDQFIPVAEHSGLIVGLGQWVLHTACRAMRRLLDSGTAPLRMAVNVSVAQLQDPGFLASVRGALVGSGLQGQHLELEITESVAVLPTRLLESTLAALRAEGISVAIDDFGTGYSSLSYLERLPLDCIKIDRAFVRQLREGSGARIAELVAQLGRQLGLRVMAEGIEDAATWDALRAMGCDAGQGYHLAHPMGDAELTAWLQSRGAAGTGSATERFAPLAAQAALDQAYTPEQAG